jgi:hypothetical protein
MSKNYIRLELGGKERGLPFKMGTLRKLKGLTNSDPYGFLSSINVNDIDDQAKIVSTIIHACLLASCESKKESPDFTVEDIEVWINDLDANDWADVINAFIRAYIGEPSGEEGKDTQGSATDVAGNA